VVIGAGIVVSAFTTANPIEAFMFFIRDSFGATSNEGAEILDGGEDEEPEFIVPDISFPGVLSPEDAPGEDVTVPDVTFSPETTVDPQTDPDSTVNTDPGTTAKPKPETTAKPKPETTVKPRPETTVKPPETTVKPPASDENYFSDALFLGDSRTVGFYLYARIPGATYFARTSMSVFNVFAEKKSETGDTSSYKDLVQLLTQKKFGKIYILLGINEIGYSYSSIVKNYSETIKYIRQMQPDAKIIIQSNMHVTKKKSDANPNSFSNARINELNRQLSSLADGKKIFYLSFEKIFDDSNGAMSSEYSGDGVHLYAKCYKLWRDWMLNNGKI
jgi:lysophospholipase L1-like esterase